MNQFITRKIIGDNFNYTELNKQFNENDIKKGKRKLENNFSKINKNWNTEKNTEWVLRNYLATKMIMSTTVMLTSLQYGREKNIKITEPYLIYYSLLSISRAVVFTDPVANWNSGDLINTTHNKIINIVGNSIAQFNLEKGKEIKELLEKAKEYRELFSYKFPANGINDFKLSLEKTIELCSFMSEIAQFQSKILEQKNLKNETLEVNLDRDLLEKGFMYNGKKYDFIDEDDWRRIDYIVRKQPFPVNLYHTLSEGMVEDFFGAWCDYNNDDDNNYNPDDNWHLIFPMP